MIATLEVGRHRSDLLNDAPLSPESKTSATLGTWVRVTEGRRDATQAKTLAARAKNLPRLISSSDPIDAPPPV
jgi:hypothetical protein